ncbi:MAG: glycoside hydrolase family 3 N-terminal domain-containing protein [Bacteroidota bacterium]|nr:glycoside hydrolase family 3 N-terminal domain-containing protein [Bacteroidota bacterium]MDP4233413.1 glycoside hydrolase family 3 N-terminal domain-containing protein [Bacteroidota bacterium]MDP4242279.1 glycoside hydrolase family 3 N-terminal domain-containing protein [Bacteroidota bacterium]MDP4287035.1 glycoside hydrolase family 3 N-terminal domain-containing protein [Bacteroidota bacterium]
MSPEETFLGQVLMPRLNAEAFAEDSAYRERIFRLVRENKAGGFCMFGSQAESVANAVTVLQNEAGHRTHLDGTPKSLIFSADCEFGLPMRFECGTEFPDAMAIAKAGEPGLAYQVGQAIANEMRALGLSWNFAPVADVNSNPDNPIINTRSFGDNPETVSTFALPFMLGLQSEHVNATAKHFPGHGDTSVDSHRALPVILDGVSRFEKIELPPFRSMIQHGVKSIMTGHLATPEFARVLGAQPNECELPATISRLLTTELLRNRLGFDGVIVTDALEMRAIRASFDDGEATVKAFLAGADIILMPPEPEIAFDALLQATNHARITSGHILARISRIRSLKTFAGNPAPNLERLSHLESENKSLATEIARRAIELTGKAEMRSRSLIVLIDNGAKAIQRSEEFIAGVRSLFDSIKTVVASSGEIPILNEDTVLAVFHRARGYIDSTATEWSVPRMMRSIGATLAEHGPGFAGLILFGDPYLDRHFAPLGEHAPHFILKAFSESSASIEAATETLRNIRNVQ